MVKVGRWTLSRQFQEDGESAVTVRAVHCEKGQGALRSSLELEVLNQMSKKRPQKREMELSPKEQTYPGKAAGAGNYRRVINDLP